MAWLIDRNKLVTHDSNDYCIPWCYEVVIRQLGINGISELAAGTFQSTFYQGGAQTTTRPSARQSKRNTPIFSTTIKKCLTLTRSSRRSRNG